jgi:hypothetical protein
MQRRLLAPPLLEHRLAPCQRAFAGREALDRAVKPPAAQRRIDLVLDSVRRLLRIGATANLLNLLQKQHPADLAQIFSELHES